LQGAVRDKALQYRDSSNAAIVDHVTRGMPDAVAQRIKRQNLLRVANNAKRGHGADQVNKPADEIEFTEAYSTTAAGEHFLLYDSRHPEAGQPPIVIFASATGIQSLRGSRDWGSDGNCHLIKRMTHCDPRYVSRCAAPVRLTVHGACDARRPFACLRCVHAATGSYSAHLPPCAACFGSCGTARGRCASHDHDG